MFTGIIEEIGLVEAISDNKITIRCSKVLEDTKLGDSISVNGVCLTVYDIHDNGFCADISQETRKSSNFNKIQKGTSVNLERALCLSSRLGGHLVTGHIDTIGTVLKISKLSEFYEITVGFDEEYSKYSTRKGSVTINGISLTIAQTGNDYVTVAIIPHTYINTGLSTLKQGDIVNIEFDILAKYVEKILSSSDNNSITVDFLAENGFV